MCIRDSQHDEHIAAFLYRHLIADVPHIGPGRIEVVGRIALPLTDVPAGGIDLALSLIHI